MEAPAASPLLILYSHWLVAILDGLGESSSPAAGMQTSRESSPGHTARHQRSSVLESKWTRQIEGHLEPESSSNLLKVTYEASGRAEKFIRASLQAILRCFIIKPRAYPTLSTQVPGTPAAHHPVAKASPCAL